MNETARTEKSRTIARLNDAFRATLEGGTVYVTEGVQALSPDDRAAVLRTVRAFDDFTAASDPNGLRDHGAFGYADRRFFWKIDYYDEAGLSASEDPADPDQTTRVLTIGFPGEY